MGHQRSWRARATGWASRTAHGPGTNRALQGAYTTLIDAEWAVSRTWAGRHGRGPVDPGVLTVVVKTFERPTVSTQSQRPASS